MNLTSVLICDCVYPDEEEEDFENDGIDEGDEGDEDEDEVKQCQNDKETFTHLLRIIIFQDDVDAERHYKHFNHDEGKYNDEEEEEEVRLNLSEYLFMKSSDSPLIITGGG